MASSARERLRNASRRLTAGQGNNAPAAKKSLGQHFLTNPGICRRIVDLIAPSGSDSILEIGPGPGALTGVLANDPRPRYQHDSSRVYALEFAGLEVKFTVDGDVLTVISAEKSAEK